VKAGESICRDGAVVSGVVLGGLGGAAGGAGGAGGGGGGGGRGFFGAGRGALVDPGEYTVEIAAGEKTDSITVTVEEDPRVQFSQDDRSKRRKALETLTAMTKEADEARRKAAAMNTALTNLIDSWKQPNAPVVPDSVKKAADDLMAKVKPVAAVFENAAGGGRGGAGGGAGAAPPYTPPPVVQKIARLMGAIDGYTAAPTSRQLADIDEAKAQLQKGVADVNSLWDEVPKLNRLMLEAGVPYFTVSLAPTPAGGGRGRGN
jgi:hypothetical protein